MDKQVTVLGGAGFIGSHLVDRLVAGDYHVNIVDNFSRGSHANIEQAVATGNVTVRQLNLEHSKPALWSSDVVFHLAAKVTGIEYNRGHHYDMLMTNLAITKNVIESVEVAKPKLFVYVSTACVYPHDAPVPTPESAGDVGNPEPTNHGYGVAKWVGEQMVKHLSRECGIPCLIVRFFNAFGPRDYYDKETSHVAPALIRRVMEGENPVTVWGSGNQTRALVDARDIAKALVLLMDWATQDQTMYEGKYPPGPFVFNIGHQREVSIKQLVETILWVCDAKRDVVFDTSKPDGYARRAADTTRLLETIGFVPNMSLEKTLHDMVWEYEQGRAHL